MSDKPSSVVCEDAVLDQVVWYRWFISLLVGPIWGLLGLTGLFAIALYGLGIASFSLYLVNRHGYGLTQYTEYTLTFIPISVEIRNLKADVKSNCLGVRGWYIFGAKRGRTRLVRCFLCHVDYHFQSLQRMTHLQRATHES